MLGENHTLIVSPIKPSSASWRDKPCERKQSRLKKQDYLLPVENPYIAYYQCTMRLNVDGLQHLDFMILSTILRNKPFGCLICPISQRKTAHFER